MVIRKPAVSNQFYPGDPTRLHYEVGRLMGPQTTEEPAKAVVAPHAGYMYSGHVAGAVFSRVRVPKKCIILGPNHTGFGANVAVMAQGAWAMPMGMVQVDSQLADLILRLSNVAEEDLEAHMFEHSLEVQVPFLQYKQKDLEIVPICLMRLSYSDCLDLGTAISEAIARTESQVLIVASTDMSHYVSQREAEMKDNLALNCIERLDPEGLYKTVIENQITMCGFIPTTVALIAALKLGAQKATLIKYATSGDVTGDYRQVVGYAGFLIQ